MDRTNKGSERKLNRGCELVLQALAANQKLTSAQDIHLWLKHNAPIDAPGLTTVYRAVETLLKLDLIQAVDFGDGEKRYERVEPGDHHHHLLCTSCMNSIHLDQCFIDKLVQNVEARHQFKVRTHVLEIFGLCGECQRRGARAPR